MVLLMLPAGELCDRVQPRRVLATGLTLLAVCALGLMEWRLRASPPLWTLYALLILSGADRAFADPASQALLPCLVGAGCLPRAIAWSSSVWQLAVIAGPALGGLACALGAASAYGICAAAFLVAAIGSMMLSGWRAPPAGAATLASRISRVAQGIRFVRSEPIVLGAISLDLVAVLFGGATALLPVRPRHPSHGACRPGVAAQCTGRRRLRNGAVAGPSPA